MTVKNIQSELRRIKKYYQMFGEDADAMDAAIEKLDDCKADGIIFDYFGRKYVAEKPILKTIDRKGMCSFWGFKGVSE